jgi:OOP family OmpA-OmpF porin
LRTLAWAWSVVLLAVVYDAGTARTAAAQSNQGFSLERYEPSAAGQWSFWVDHPQYDPKLGVAGGLTLDYGHHPLVLGVQKGNKFIEEQAIIAHQLYGHLDLALTLKDLLAFSVEFPVALYQNGTAAHGISAGGVAAGDPRVGAMVRLYGDPLRDAFSVHAGVQLWVPITGSGSHTGDSTVRFAPRVVLAGLVDRFMWSFLTEVMYRKQASIGTLPKGAGNSVGTELHFGGALAYADLARHFAVGPEAVMATVIAGGSAFARDYTSLEVLLGAQYKIESRWLVGLAGGLGALREPGTPDGRVILRLAYAPEQKREPEAVESDRDHDGIIDKLDQCPDVHHGPTPDPRQPGCPRPDRDKDGVFDDEDACVDAAGPRTDDKETNGCPPPPDRDGDGVLDRDDVCPDTAAGEHPDSDRNGCPLEDRDHDGVFDKDDQCVDVPQGEHPHPVKTGCPTVKDDNIVVDPIFFKTNKDILLPESIPVLQSVADIMTAHPEFERISIEGHTDDRGTPHRNLDLSARRAKTVRKWLAAHGIAASRLESHGYGQSRPIADNDSDEGRAKNRRVQFVIIKAAK